MAAALSKDPDHERCATYHNEAPRPLIIPDLVISEVCHMIDKGATENVEAEFLQSLLSEDFRIEHVVDADLERARGLILQYPKLRIGAIDGVVVAVAERLKITTIATLDHRHFTVVRPRHVDGFTLVL